MRGAAKLLADALTTARRAGATGMVIVRADSAYYGHDIIATARRAGARFSITACQTAIVTRAISSIGEDAWTATMGPPPDTRAGRAVRGGDRDGSRVHC